MPVRPCAFDGAVIEPPVCVPIDDVARRPAVAVAEPVDEPPGFVLALFGVQALRVVVMPSGVVASGPICILPSTMPPAPLRRDTAVASKVGTKSWKMYELQVVSRSLV